MSAWAVAAESGWESPEVIAVKADGKWKLIDYGTGIDNPDVPAEVRDQLWEALDGRPAPGTKLAQQGT